MSWLTGILAAVLLVVINKYWPSMALRSLRFQGVCGQVMAEPNEVVTWNGTVENRGRLPVPFVRLRETFPDSCQPCAEERWVRSHCQQGMYRWTVEERMALGPRQSVTKSL